MDLVVDVHGGLTVNSVVGAKRSKSCLNTSLSKAFASPQKIKSRTSSNESEYEVVAEIENEDSDNGACSVDEGDLDENDNNTLVRSDNTIQNNHVKVSDPSEPIDMEEVFVIVDDDANEPPDENNVAQETSQEKKNCLSDGDDLEMDEIIAEFAEQEKKAVPRLSDNEDEMDSILDEFAETNSNDLTNEKKSDTNVILSSESEDEMDCLLEEFRKENTSDQDTLTKTNLVQNKDISTVNHIRTSSCNLTNTCDTKNKFQSSVDSINLSHNEQQNCSMQNQNSLSDKNSIPVKSDCVIISDTDDKSNLSNCSSVEILIDDDSVKEVNENISLSDQFKIPSEMHCSSGNKSRSINLSEAEKNDSSNAAVNVVKENSNCINSNTEETDDICTNNIFDTNVSEASASHSESSEKSNIDSMDKVDTLDLNSKGETNDEIKIAECSEETLHPNKILNETEPLVLNNETCDAENYSSGISKINDDQIVSDNEVKLSSDVEDIVLSDTKEKLSSEKSRTDFKLNDVIKDDISSGDTDKENDKISDHDDQNEPPEEQEKMKLNDIPITDVSTVSKDLNETCTEKYSGQMEMSLESSIVNNNTQSDENNGDEKLTMESEPDEVNERNLDTVESCAANGFETEDKDLFDNAKPSLVEDLNLSVVSAAPSSSEISSTSDNKNKRKLEDEIDIDSKKLKKDIVENGDSDYLNGEEESSTFGDFGMKNTNIEELVSDVTVADYKAVDKVTSLIPWNASEVIETTNTVLDKIAMYVCQEVVKESFQKKYIEEKNKAKELEDKIETLSKNLESFRLQFADFRDTQKVAFSEQNFKAKLHTRTVGVNVKIYRESEIKQALSMQSVLKNKQSGVVSENSSIKQEKLVLEPKTESLPVASNIRAVKPNPTQLLVPNTHIRETVVSSILSPQQGNVRRHLLPRIIAQSSRPMVAAQVMSRMPQKFPPPNVTVNGNRIIPLVSSRSRTPSTHSVVLVPSSTITSSSRNNLIDLTKEDPTRNAATGTSIPTTTVAKVTVPGITNNPNVLVPLRDYLQLLPPGAKGPPVIQPSPVQRPTLIPQLPSSLIGARTVTYIVPQNSGIGARGIPQFIPPSNQQVQFVLRVTTPATASTLGPVVNSISRPATMPQTQVTAAPRTSSGLILFSHTSKHPAPFPKSPHYPDTKGKAIPPKPSLKGSKNSNGGIVLSWNMCLLRHHANISSYQLFAYQETEGPVDASLWKKVGDVNALPLPMACTLTQFVDKNRYYFTVRAVDVYQRFGPFSDPVSILYDKEGDSSTKK